MASWATTSQIVTLLLAVFISVVNAGIGPSADGVWTDKDTLAYIVVGAVSGGCIVIAFFLYCQLQYFIRVGKIEMAAELAAAKKAAQVEQAEKSRQVAAQKEKVKKDIAAQKAAQAAKEKST